MGALSGKLRNPLFLSLPLSDFSRSLPQGRGEAPESGPSTLFQDSGELDNGSVSLLEVGRDEGHLFLRKLKGLSLSFSFLLFSFGGEDTRDRAMSYKPEGSRTHYITHSNPPASTSLVLE